MRLVYDPMVFACNTPCQPFYSSYGKLFYMHTKNLFTISIMCVQAKLEVWVIVIKLLGIFGEMGYFCGVKITGYLFYRKI